MKELRKVNWLRLSWRRWLRIKRAEFLLWWYLPSIRAAGPKFDIEAAEKVHDDEIDQLGFGPPENYGVPIEGLDSLCQASPTHIPTGSGKYPTMLPKEFNESNKTDS